MDGQVSGRFDKQVETVGRGAVFQAWTESEKASLAGLRERVALARYELAVTKEAFHAAEDAVGGEIVAGSLLDLAQAVAEAERALKRAEGELFGAVLMLGRAG